MKLVKALVLTLAAALLFTSCVKTGTNDVLGTYSVTCDINVARSEGSGVIYFAMYDAVVKVSRGMDFRTSANDKTVIAEADKIANEYKDQANKEINVSVVFIEANALGEAEKKPVVIKTYNFKPVN